MKSFSARLELLGVNPFVQVPSEILEYVFTQAGKSKGPIRISGTLNGRPYRQTLVKYAGLWRLYVNLIMLDKSPRRIGETLAVTIGFDSVAKKAATSPALEKALANAPEARQVFERLPPSRQQELVRYLAGLKTEISLARNVERTIGFLLGRGRFLGRDRP